MDTNVCCLCLCKDKCIKSMFADEESDVAGKIFMLTGVEFNQHDGLLPTGTCIDCIVQLEEAWKFRLQIQKSYASLQFVYNPENDTHDEMMIEMPLEVNVDVKPEILNFESETCSNFIPGHYLSQSSCAVDNPQCASEENFDCVLCGKVLNTKNEAVRHLIQHSQKNKAPKSKKVKSKVVERPTTSTELTTVPTALHGFDCDICGQCYDSKKKIINHVLKAHAMDKKTFLCAYCDLKFLSQARCLWHISRTHAAQ